MSHDDVEPVGVKGRCPGLAGACEGDESNAFQLYSDGHGYCHAGSCPKKFWSPKDLATKGFDMDGLELGEAPSGYSLPTNKAARDVDLNELIERSSPNAITDWKVLRETAEKWDYRAYKNSDGEKVHVAVYRDETGSPVAAKVRNTAKPKNEGGLYWVGGSKDRGLYGLNLLPQSGKKVVVVEGEKDALSMSQLLTAYPVVSIPNGAGPQTKKDMARFVERLSKFEEVVLCFDPDPAGILAMQECARLFAPGKVSLAKLPGGMDVTELVQAGRSKEVTGAVFHPEAFRPDGIVSLNDLKSEMLSPTVTGRPYPWRFLTDWTYGRRDGEVLVLAAGTGGGQVRPHAPDRRPQRGGRSEGRGVPAMCRLQLRGGPPDHRQGAPRETLGEALPHPRPRRHPLDRHGAEGRNRLLRGQLCPCLHQ